MSDPVRTTTLDTPCPRCGGPLKQEERGVMAAESGEPVRWLPGRRYCASGCLLTVADFPEGQA